MTILMPIPASRQRATAARDVLAHGVRDGGHRREVQPARLDRFEAVVRRGFRPRHGQRAHGAALEPEELFGDLRVLAVRGAHRAHDLRAPFTQRMRRPEMPLSMIVAMYLRSVEKVSRLTIFASARSGS